MGTMDRPAVREVDRVAPMDPVIVAGALLFVLGLAGTVLSVIGMWRENVKLGALAVVSFPMVAIGWGLMFGWLYGLLIWVIAAVPWVQLTATLISYVREFGWDD